MKKLLLIFLTVAFLIGVVFLFKKQFYVGGILMVLSTIGIIIVCVQHESFDTVDLQCGSLKCPAITYVSDPICNIISNLHSWKMDTSGQITIVDGIKDQDGYAFRGRVKVAQQLDQICDWLNRDISQNQILLDTLLNYFYSDNNVFTADSGFLTSPLADLIKSSFKGLTFVNDKTGVNFNIIVNSDKEAIVVLNNIEYQFGACDDQFIKTDDPDTTVVLVMGARASYVIGNVCIDMKLTGLPEDIAPQRLSDNIFVTVNNHDCQLGFVFKPDETDFSKNIISLGYIRFEEIDSTNVTMSNIRIANQDLQNIFVGAFDYLPNYDCIVTTRFEDNIYVNKALPRDMTFLFLQDPGFIKSFQDSIKAMLNKPPSLLSLNNNRFLAESTTSPPEPVDTTKQIEYVNFIHSYFSYVMSTIVYAATNGYNIGIYPPIDASSGRAKDGTCFYPPDDDNKSTCDKNYTNGCQDFLDGVCGIDKNLCCQGGSFKFVSLTCLNKPEKRNVFLLTQTVLAYIDAAVGIFYGSISLQPVALAALAVTGDLKKYEQIALAPFRLLDCKNGSFQPDLFNGDDVNPQFFSCVGVEDVRVCSFSLHVNPNMQLQDFKFISGNNNIQTYSMLFNMFDNNLLDPNRIEVNVKAHNSGYFQYLTNGINLEDIPGFAGFYDAIASKILNAKVKGAIAGVFKYFFDLLWKFPLIKPTLQALGNYLAKDKKEYFKDDRVCPANELTPDMLSKACPDVTKGYETWKTDYETIKKLLDVNENNFSPECLNDWKKKYDTLQQIRKSCTSLLNENCMLKFNEKDAGGKLLAENPFKDEQYNVLVDNLTKNTNCGKSYAQLNNDFTTIKNVGCPVSFYNKWTDINTKYKNCGGSTYCVASGLGLNITKYEETCNPSIYNDIQKKTDKKINKGEECEKTAEGVRERVEEIKKKCSHKEAGDDKSKEDVADDQLKANLANYCADIAVNYTKAEIVKLLKAMTTIQYDQNKLNKGNQFWDITIAINLNRLQIKLENAEITSDVSNNTAKWTNLDTEGVVNALYEMNKDDIDLGGASLKVSFGDNFDIKKWLENPTPIGITYDWISMISYGIVREFVQNIFTEQTKDKVIADINGIADPLVIIPVIGEYAVAAASFLTELIEEISEYTNTGMTTSTHIKDDDPEKEDKLKKQNRFNAAIQKLFIFVVAIITEACIRNYVKDKVETRVKNGITKAAKNLLQNFNLPFALPSLYLFENTFDCVCTNVCARNWENILTNKYSDWKASSCAGAYTSNMNPVSCGTNFVKEDGKNYCLCMDDSKQRFPSWEPNAQSNPAVTYCNRPLYVYDIPYTNDPSNNPTSCDYVCQQHISNYYPGIMSSYCLNARLLDTSQNIPCAQQTTSNLECLCYKDNYLYIKGATSSYNIYGILNDPLILNDVFIYCDYNDKFLVNFKNDAGQNIVDGLAISSGSLNPNFTKNFQTSPITINIYGERAIWNFIPTTQNSGLNPPFQNPNIFFLNNKFDDSFLFDPNDPIDFDITTMNKDEMIKSINFVDLLLIKKDDVSKNITRCMWKIIKSGNKYSLVNVFSNRCILGYDAAKIKTAFHDSIATDSPIGLKSAPGSYNNYNEINLWRLKQATSVKPSNTNLQNELQVVNMTNVAYQSVMTYVSQFSNIPDTVVLTLQDGTKLPFSLKEYENKLSPMPYPPNNYLPNNQFLLEKTDTGNFRIRSLLNNDTNYLMENKEDGSVTIQVVDAENATLWKIDSVEKYHTVTSVATGNILIRTAPTVEQISGFFDGDSKVKAQIMQKYAPVVSDFKFFITVDKKTITDPLSHIPYWSLTTATPVVNPINNQRLNVVCPIQSILTADSEQPPIEFCDQTGDSINLKNVNILQADLNNNTSCVVNTASLLEMRTSGTQEEILKYYQDIESLVKDHKIPTYTSLTSPCYLYGGRSTFSIDGDYNGGVQIQTSSGNCLGVDENNRLIEKECSTTPLWKISGLSTTGQREITLATVTDYLYNYDYYYCMNVKNYNLMVYTNQFDLFEASKMNSIQKFQEYDGSNNQFARVQFMKDLSTGSNYMRFASKPGANFIGCKIDPSTIKLGLINIPISDYKYELYCKNVSGVATRGKNLPAINTGLVEPGLFENTPDNQNAIELDFILVNYQTGAKDTVYCYLIRLKNSVTINNNKYTAYLATTEDNYNLSVKFIVWPVEDNDYDYSITISPYLQCLLKTYNDQVRWVFTNTQNLSNQGQNLRTYQICTNDQKMCLSKQGTFENGQFTCAGCTASYPNLNVSYFDLQPGNVNDNSQHFFFQTPNYQPADFPYLKESSIPQDPEPKKPVLFNSFFKS